MKKTFLVSILSLSIFFVIGAVVVSAQAGGIDNPGTGGIDNPPGGGIDNPIGIHLKNPFNCGGSGDCTIFTFLRAVIDGILLPIGGVLAVLAFIYSGFLFVTAQGNETKLATAKKALLYTAIGTAVLLGSWAIAKVIENTINQLK